MDYFDQDGHLTVEALNELIYGEPDELTRLEIAEHLSYCDDCVNLYSKLLTESVLITPDNSQVVPIMRRIKLQVRNIFLNKYATATIAAGFAMFLWVSGAFTPSLIYKEIENTNYQQRQEQKYEFYDKVDQAWNQIYDKFSNWRGDLGNGK